MFFLKLAVSLSLLLRFTAFSASTNRINVSTTAAAVVPTPKCSPAVNNFYAGPSTEIKKVLSEIQRQLDELREDIRPWKYRNGTVFKNCAELYRSGERISGVYMIDPINSGPFEVFCDQKTAGGGWTVFQKRIDGSVDFYRGWLDYQQGFGNLNGEFWLGLDKIHQLTSGERNRLRVELEDTKGNVAYAEYDLFAVSSGRTKYKLSLGTYSGTAGDSFSFQNGGAFSTKDQDNENDKRHCARRFKGGWWYTFCRRSNLNSLYHLGTHSSYADGVNWRTWKGDYYSAKRAEMKIRPVNF